MITRSVVAEDRIWVIMIQLLKALDTCHKGGDSRKPVIHRDLKPGNIFLDGSSNIKIGDFGLARVMNGESQFAYTHVGTPYYMSPE